MHSQTDGMGCESTSLPSVLSAVPFPGYAVQPQAGARQDVLIAVGGTRENGPDQAGPHVGLHMLAQISAPNALGSPADRTEIDRENRRSLSIATSESAEEETEG